MIRHLFTTYPYHYKNLEFSGLIPYQHQGFRRYADRSFRSSHQGGIWAKACLPSEGNPSPRQMLSYGTRTNRRPMLLFLLSGLLLFRFEVRQFLALLFQLPPRFTRLESLGFRPSAYAIA